MRKIIFLTLFLLILTMLVFSASDPVFSIWNVKNLKAGDKLTYAISSTGFNGKPRFEKVDISVLPAKEKGKIWLEYKISNPLGTSATPSSPLVKNVKGKKVVNSTKLVKYGNKPVHVVKMLVDKQAEDIEKLVAPDIFEETVDFKKGNLKANSGFNRAALFKHLKNPDAKEKVIGIEMVKTPAGTFKCKHIQRELVKTKKVQNGHFLLITTTHYNDDYWVSEKGKFVGIVKAKRRVRVENKFQNTLAPERDYKKLNRVKSKVVEKVLESYSR